MPAKGTIHGTHHLTFCVGTAQEDYDFHVRLLGLKSVKKTVLFRSEEHTSELQSLTNLVCRLLLEKKKKK